MINLTVTKLEPKYKQGWSLFAVMIWILENLQCSCMNFNFILGDNGKSLKFIIIDYINEWMNGM